MYRIVFVILILLLNFTPTIAGDQDTKISNLLNHTIFKKDPGIKILEAKFEKAGTTQYYDKWQSTIKVKSCYTANVICSGDGNFEGGENFIGGFNQIKIEKLSTVDNVSTIRVSKEDISTITSFKLSIKCHFISSEHSNSHSGSDPYWKQFLPEKNECN